MKKAAKLISTGALALGGGIALGRIVASQVAKYAINILMTDSYTENLAEFYSAAKRTGIQEILETNIRAEEGKLILRPLGSPRSFVDFTGLMFTTAHLAKRPTPPTIPVKTQTIIGRQAKRPLVIETPILVSGMAYGLALSKAFKYAFAAGSAKAGTATNTGEGPLLPKERELAHKLIIQYPRASWNKDPSILRQADAIEIQIGQGASASTGHMKHGSMIDGPLRNDLGTKPGQGAIIFGHMPELGQSGRLGELVKYLRAVTGGVPIGVKFSFTDRIEKDIDVCLDAEVDFLAIEGAQAATIGSPPILQDDFGLPTIIGLCRAVQHLKLRNAQDKVSLIAAGGFSNPGQSLKALALGADAVYLGTMALFATSHTQVLKTVPWEPPTQIAVYNGKRSKDFKWKQGAQNLAKYLKSFTEEMQEGVRALGELDIHAVNRSDMIALDEQTSQITGVPLAYSNRKVRAVVAPGVK